MHAESPAAALQDATPDPTQDMTVLTAETESLLPHKQSIVKALLEVASGHKHGNVALEELLPEIPEPLRPAVRRRFAYEIGLIANRKQQAAAQQPKSGGIVIFYMAAAILLMATGTYESIRDLLRSHPNLKTQVTQMGATMLRHGITPDMKMVEKLQRIILRAQEYEREQQQAQQQQRCEDRVT